MNPTMDLCGIKELDARVGDGLEVRLLWQGGPDVLVEITDARCDERLVFPVAAHQALDAFRHPFAYAARAGELDDACDVAAITF